ncbi:hypothetical protein B0H17DRAFT_1069478 [Mycena rosella]|uniref:Uncharacterized protein n=1 Tax=Mycena rosella TaxID=1033263 RepID=A0AAD7DBN6_MYCRO|nr:hypothetical protein B0H17DRAFT_1069478 [Mycena rosella]
MSTDTRYTAKEALAWETYDDDYIAFTKKEKGHPGPVPPGYVESYMLRHPKAPHPAKYPALEAEWANRHATGPVQRGEGTGVFLPNDAFSTLLNHQALMAHQVGQLAHAHKAIPTAPRAMVHYQPKNYGVRAKFRGPKGGLVAASGWKRGHVAKAVAKGKAKAKGKRGKAKWGRIRVAAVKTETTEVAEREMTPLAEEIEEGMVAPEDIFMADYTKFKDEDDDNAAAGSLLSNDAPVEISA